MTDIPIKLDWVHPEVFLLLIKAIYLYNQKKISKRELAEFACDIEIDNLNRPSGKQDQYISVYGGVSNFY